MHELTFHLKEGTKADLARVLTRSLISELIGLLTTELTKGLIVELKTDLYGSKIGFSKLRTYFSSLTLGQKKDFDISSTFSASVFSD